jgi:sugar phosphate isomerase/epimerase
VVGTTSPAHAGRWLKAPPLAEQQQRLAAALKRLAPVVEANGLKIAVENHADYRGHELAAVLEEVDSPAVGAKLDTGNAFAAVEDPTAAAQALAPFVFATHVKDVRVESEPWGRRDQVPEAALIPNGLLVMLEVALGEGHVDFDTILPLLAERGPLGNDLSLVIEDKARTIEQSVAYARQHFAAHL